METLIGKDVLWDLLEREDASRVDALPVLAERLGCPEEAVVGELLALHGPSLEGDAFPSPGYALAMPPKNRETAIELYWRAAVELASIPVAGLKRLDACFFRSKDDADAKTLMRRVLPVFAQVAKPLQEDDEDDAHQDDPVDRLAAATLDHLQGPPPHEEEEPPLVAGSRANDQEEEEAEGEEDAKKTNEGLEQPPPSSSKGDAAPLVVDAEEEDAADNDDELEEPVVEEVDEEDDDANEGEQPVVEEVTKEEAAPVAVVVKEGAAEQKEFVALKAKRREATVEDVAAPRRTLSLNASYAKWDTFDDDDDDGSDSDGEIKEEEASTKLSRWEEEASKSRRPGKSVEETKPFPLQRKKEVNLSASYTKWDNFDDGSDDEGAKQRLRAKATLDQRFCAIHNRTYSGSAECPWCAGVRKVPERPKAKPATWVPSVDAVDAAAAATAASAALQGTDPRRIALRDDMIVEARRIERDADCDVDDLRRARIALENRVKDDRRQNDVIHSLKTHLDDIPDDDVSFGGCFHALQKASRFMPPEYADKFKEAVGIGDDYLRRGDRA